VALFGALIGTAGLVAAAATPAGAVAPVRIGVLKFGTVNWELDVIRRRRFDREQGVDVQTTELGSKNAVAVALQSGAVDIIVTDWIWVSRQRSEGRLYSFAPYSLAVGSLLVRPDAGIETLADLGGRKLGIGGGPVDKSWLLLRAYARRILGKELAELVEPTFAAPPLLNELALAGDLPAVLNFWHFAARLEAAGMRKLISVQEILRHLGMGGDVPLLGWVFSEQWASANRTALDGFLKASFRAKQLMLTSDREWRRLYPLTKAGDQATLTALRDAWRAGVPTKFGDQEIVDAARLFGVLSREGGERLVGRGSELAPGTFWIDFAIDRYLP
jgi:NitT/TauT family transport system substrate-binding protein